MIEYLYLFIYKAFALLVKILPERWLDSGIYALARFAYFASPSRRQVIHSNLTFCFPDMPQKEQKQIAIHSYKNLLYNIASFLNADKKRVVEKIHFENRQVADEALQRGQKVIFITAHLGVWELLSAAITLGFKTPFSVVGRELDSKLMHKHLKIAREQIGVELINKKGALKGMIKALNKGRTLGLLVDQSLPKSTSVDVKFFGTTITQTPAASIMAHKFDAVIIPIFITSTDCKNHTVTCYEPIMIDKNVPKEEDIKRLNQAQADIIEKVIKAYPSEWFWSHKRFKVYNKEIYHDR